MDNILAAKVLMSHLPEITDGAYKTATEIAIETILQDAMHWYEEFQLYEEVTPTEYLGLSQEDYNYWLLGKRY